ncbi:MAG: transposase [Anaerolineales bacterium]|nr:transposase [Anaerolineales bacterium]
MAKALRENIHYIWLGGISQPDHRTINRFRGVVMKKVVEQLFELGYVNLDKYFVDGTKPSTKRHIWDWEYRKGPSL